MTACETEQLYSSESLRTPKRILLLTTSLLYGGAEIVVVELALSLRRRGWGVSVVSMLPPEAFVEVLEAAGVQVFSLGMRCRGLNVGGIIRLNRYVRSFRPDLIHGHMFHANILARLIGCLWKVPALCTIHNTVESSRRKDSARFREWIYRLTDRACVRTTAVSEGVRQRCVRAGIVPPHRISVIPNGVDCERFRPCPVLRNRTRTEMGWNGAFIWLCAARLERAKDFPNLIRGFLEARCTFPNCRLMIAGDGMLRPQIASMIVEADLVGSVSLLGLRTDIPDLMNACDALVMASAWEGGPLVLLEAAACGRPVVATKVGAAAEIVEPGRTGFLVPPRDHRALAQAMAEVMNLDPERLGEMGRNALRHVTCRYSKEHVFEMYSNLYEETLAN